MNPTPKPSADIVVGVDATEESGHAACWAAREAVDRSSILTVMHALGLPQAGS